MRFFFTSFLLLFFNVCFGQKFPDSCHTAFWGVVNAKGDTSYLLGTFHEFGNSFFKKFPATQKYRTAECIVTETVFPAGKKVELSSNWVKSLSKQERKILNSYLRTNFGYKLRQVRHAPPGWIHAAIFSKLYQKQCNIWNEKDLVGMDEYLMNGSVTFKIKLMGLEVPEDTFNVKNIMAGAKSNSDSTGVLALKDIIINQKKYLDTITTMCWEADNYKNMDLNYKFTSSSISDNPDFAILLDKRNDSWMPELKRIVDSNKAYVAVGIKHLYYRKGLIQQLTNSGYTVFPIPLK